MQVLSLYIHLERDKTRMYFYMISLRQVPPRSAFYPSVWAGRSVLVLLHGNDATTSISQMWLRQCLRVLDLYCIENYLVITHNKTEVFVFSRILVVGRRSWKIDSVSINQTETLKYLRISFSAWKKLKNKQRSNLGRLRASQTSFCALLHSGKKHVLMLITHYEARAMSYLLCATTIYKYHCVAPFEATLRFYRGLYYMHIYIAIWILVY